MSGASLELLEPLGIEPTVGATDEAYPAAGQASRCPFTALGEFLRRGTNLCVELVGPRTVLARMVYALANPVKDHLVELR